MTDTYKIWTPKFEGDAPPNWRQGMTYNGGKKPGPTWIKGYTYHVPSEAIGAPEITAEAFIAWARANADKLPDGVAEALGPERDWADELHEELQDTKPSERTAIIKSRCRPIGNDTVTDEWLAKKVGEIVDHADRGMFTSAKDALRAIIAEATQ